MRKAWKRVDAVGSALIVAALLGFVIWRTVTGAGSQRPASGNPASTGTIAPPTRPLSSFGYNVVEDPATKQVVLFGGVDNYDNTYLWDGRRWLLAHPKQHPPGRFNAAAAYDPLTRLVMVYGGRLAPGQVVNDTWGWDGKTWTELDNGTGNPPAGEGGAMAWDDALAEMVLVFADETWIWAGRHWSRLSAADPNGPGLMGFDPVSKALVGVTLRQANGNTTAATVRWDGTSWHELPTGTTPSAFTDAITSGSMSFAGPTVNPRTNRLLLAIASSKASGSAAAWEWNGSAWTLVGSAQGPLQLTAAVTDVIHGRFLVFGISSPATQGSPQAVHVWDWDGSRWQQLDGNS